MDSGKEGVGLEFRARGRERGGVLSQKSGKAVFQSALLTSQIRLFSRVVFDAGDFHRRVCEGVRRGEGREELGNLFLLFPSLGRLSTHPPRHFSADRHCAWIGATASEGEARTALSRHVLAKILGFQSQQHLHRTEHILQMTLRPATVLCRGLASSRYFPSHCLALTLGYHIREHV